MTFTCQNNSMCWGLMHHLDAESSKMNDSFRNSEWGPEAAEQMCKEVRDFPIPGGINNNLTLGDLIDKTPQHLISKVMLEEKVFDTWFHGRTVLLGDACHKFNPAGGQGAVNAIQDAIALANWINTLNADSTWDETAKVFSEYRSERHPWAQHAFTDSQVMSKLVAMNFMGRVARYAAKNMPVWLQRAAFSRIATNRPQVAYLPLAPDRGQTKAVKQNSLIKTQKILATRAKKQQQEADKAPKAINDKGVAV
ncbi:hypothetical protein MVEG_06088 [Podila verticillata NRRL 6337]|nr:hypothetical protein MVEG_06088 [Podila verticillata NRRL 6337]